VLMQVGKESIHPLADCHFGIQARVRCDLRTGCSWRYLPSGFPPWQTVYYHFRQFCRTCLWTHLWGTLREAERRCVGKDPHPSAAIMDAQSVKTVEESARIRGFDASVCVKGSKTASARRYLGSADLGLCHACGYARYARRPSATSWTEILRPTTQEDLGRRCLQGARIGRLVQSARRLRPRSRQALAWCTWIRCPPETLDRGVFLRMAFAESTPE
jgi:transposase